MTSEENKKRAEDAHVKYIAKNLCDKNGNKSFVFISYKSDDWKIVLHDIVYRLVKDYGLNVYFDGSFEFHNALWTNQLRENMASDFCKGVLAFVDDKYASSYATLLELMYSQTINAEKKQVVLVNIGKLTKIGGAEGDRDTGLGVEYDADGIANVNAENEKKLFNETFDELVERGILRDSKFVYRKGDKLTKKKCSKIINELLAYKEINNNDYEGPDGNLEGIVKSIQDAFDNDVFSEISEIIEEDRAKKKSAGSLYTFSCYGERYEKKKLKEMMLTVFKQVLEKNSDKLKGLVEILPCLCTGNKIDKMANPSVFRAGEVVLIDGQEISIGTSLNEKTVLDYIERLIKSCKESRDVFDLKEKVPKEDYANIDVSFSKDNIQSVNPDVKTDLADLEGEAISRGKKMAADTYNFELYGMKYEDKKLKELMLIVFKQVMPRYPDKVEELLDKLPCLGEGIEIRKDAKPSVFRQGDTIVIESRRISIGTSLGRSSVMNYIGRLMTTCGENRENLKIDNYGY